MSTIPTSRIYKGWAKEFFWFLLVLLQAPIGLIYRESFLKARSQGSGRGQTIIILADALCSPLMYRRLGGQLARDGFHVLILSSATIFSGLRQHAARLSEILALREIRQGIIVGHGMGSLIALNLPDAARQRIQHLISLGTPFHGTRLLMPLSFVPALRDMAVGSEYLLLNRMNALLFPLFDPFSAFQDQWIVPFNLTHFGQGRDLILDQVGHYNIVMGGENVATIAEVIADRYPVATTAVAAAHLQLDRPGIAQSPAPAKVSASTNKKSAENPAAKSSGKKTGKKTGTASRGSSRRK